MTDQTTARARAIEAEQVAVSIVGRVLHAEGCEESLRHARTIVRTMRQSPEVLRALAGVPTADVADRWDPSDLTIMGEYLCVAVGRCTCGPFEGQHEQHCGYEPIVDLDDVRRLSVAVPEDAPTADVAAFVADTESRFPGLREPDALSDWSKGVAWVLDRARAFAAAAPEGVDAADERDALVEPDYVGDGIEGCRVGGGLDVERDATGTGDPTIRIGGVEYPPRRVRALRDALTTALDELPDGMDLEAQGAMADELTATDNAKEI